MADRTSAEIFGEVFRKLGQTKNDTIDKRKFALWLWELQQRYDFSHEQMNCQEELVKLGLATKMGIDPDYPEDSEIWLYGPEES